MNSMIEYVLYWMVMALQKQKKLRKVTQTLLWFESDIVCHNLLFTGWYTMFSSCVCYKLWLAQEKECLKMCEVEKLYC